VDGTLHFTLLYGVWNDNKLMDELGKLITGTIANGQTAVTTLFISQHNIFG